MEKKTRQLESLGAEAKVAATIQGTGADTGGGAIPRLLEWLDRAIQDQATNR
ncbi:MAG: hypothetical protein R3F44_09410 [Candidatus Competibacteraceae bacterium]